MTILHYLRFALDLIGAVTITGLIALGVIGWAAASQEGRCRD